MIKYADFYLQEAPPWLNDGAAGTAFLQVLGTISDAMILGAIQAVKVRWIASAPVDSLQWHGKDRGLDRGVTETDSAYRARIIAAWDAWKGTPTTGGAGTGQGLTRAVQAIGFPNVKIIENRQWSPDGDATQWARYWVQLTPPFPAGFMTSLPAYFDDGSSRYDDGFSAYSGIDGTISDLLLRVIRTWQPSHAILQWIEVYASTATYDDGVTAYDSPSAFYVDPVLIYG